MNVLKDEQLIALAEAHNVAQFISFGPGASPRVRYQRVREVGQFEGSIDDWARILLKRFPSANVRTFHEEKAKGLPFDYGITDPETLAALVSHYSAAGLYVIVNETVDKHDGGVSGVALGGIIEFTPDDTPRAVEQPGTVAMSHDMAIRLLETVYGFTPELPKSTDHRIEFSIHPARRGFRHTHTLLWENESVNPVVLEAEPDWPNRFSRFLGDKAFGLLIAHLSGFPVPRTQVFSRRVAPFSFGSGTGTSEWWTRTCPAVQTPGEFTTTFGWTDPYLLLAKEDPSGKLVASILAQEAVDAAYSGATKIDPMKLSDVEGVPGRGDAFMQGTQKPADLPRWVKEDVLEFASRLRKTFGITRFEWAHDGKQVWVLQLHVFKHGHVVDLNPGHRTHWLYYDPASGLETLRGLVGEALRTNAGVIVTGPVGITSHVGDVLRKAQVPARFQGSSVGSSHEKQTVNCR